MTRNVVEVLDLQILHVGRRQLVWGDAGGVVAVEVPGHGAIG